VVLRLPFLLFSFGAIYRLASFSLTITMFMVPARCLLVTNSTTFQTHLPTQSISHFYWLHIKCLDKLQEFPTPKLGVHIRVRTQNFRGGTPKFVRSQSFIFCKWGLLERPSVFSFRLKMETHFIHAFLTSVKPLATASRPFKRCDSPCPNVSMRASIQVEHIFSICCELWLVKQ
jgi:hypothetical protein